MAVGGRDKAWPALLVALLNAEHPCGGSHAVDNLCVKAVASDYWIDALVGWRDNVTHPSAAALRSADVVFLELAVNDLANVRSDLGVGGDDAESVIRGLTEVLLLLLRQLPNAPGVMYVGASSRGARSSNYEEDPRRGSSIKLHADVASQYQAPVVSVTDAIGWPQTPSSLSWYWDVFRYHDCCHPSAYGQAIVARLVLHGLELAVAAGIDEQLQPPAPVLPTAPRFASAEAARMYLTAWPLVVTPTLDRRDAQWLPQASGGWQLLTERGDKTGLVATALDARVAYTVGETELRQHCQAGRLHVAALKSYEGMGAAEIGIADCAGGVLASREVDFRWPANYSETVLTELQFACPADGCLRVAVRITSDRADGNKVKLVALTIL
jgi:lysophospholipase L1-like esterase